MPEGDTIFRAARTLQAALAGDRVTTFECVFPHVLRVHEDAPLTDRTIEHVAASGKHVLMQFSGGLVLRTHMRMSGSWHLYRPGEAWQLPRSAMRVLVATRRFVAVAFNVHDVELGGADRLLRRGIVARLGPDLLGAAFDEDEALARLRQRGAEAIADALLNQRVVAGAGNVYKSETLFLSGIHPFTPVNALDDERCRAVLRTARRLLLANAGAGAQAGITTWRGLRRTTRRSDPGERLWVYGRSGQPCRRCGTRIAWQRQGRDARSTWWCPACQPAAATGGNAPPITRETSGQ